MGMSSIIRLAVFSFTLSSCGYDIVSGHSNALFDERGWARAGQFLTEHMDRSKAPCEDFFEHVCGNYGREEETFQRVLEDQMRVVSENVRTLIERMEEAENESIGAVQEGILRFYRQCLSIHGDDEDLRKNLYAATNATVKELLSIIGDENAGQQGANNITEESRRWSAIGRMYRDFQQRSWPIDQTRTGGLVLEMGTMENGTLSIILVAISPITPEPEDLAATEPISFDELTSLVPTVRWRDYFDQILGAGTTASWLSAPNMAVFLVPDPAALREMGQLVNEMDSALFDAVIGEAVRVNLESSLLKHPPIENVQQLCLSNVVKRQAPAIAPFYLRSIGSSPSEWRRDILTMKRHVFAAFQFLLNSVDWMDERDKEKVHSKLDEVRFNPGIHDWADDEDEVIESMKQFTYDNQSTPFSAEIAWLRADILIELNYRTNVTYEEPEKVTLDVNAQNMRQLNKIEMFLGLMLPPVYDIKYPMAVKYGAIGSVIGHELIHSFDAFGLTRPSLAHKQDWLSERALQEFEKQKACLVKEYSKYCLPDQAFCISGQKNIGENMADVDGLEVAYTAFKFAKQVHGEDPPIPSMLNYTDDQLFFVTNARLWCARGWTEGWRYDSHSPDKARIEVTLANNPVFARSFQCKVGSKYAPFKTCSVWGDLVNPAAMAARRRRSTSYRKK